MMARKFSLYQSIRCLLIAISSLSLLSACVNPSVKIATELSRYGLQAEKAQCVGNRLEKNLSIGQLQQLGRAARAYGRNDATPGQLTMGDLLRVSTEIDDAKVPIEVAKAAAGCGAVDNVLQVL